jgi:hypothetical protein
MPKFSGYWDNDGHWPSRLPGQPLLGLMPARSMENGQPVNLAGMREELPLA